MIWTFLTKSKVSIRAFLTTFAALILHSHATYADIGDGPRAYFPPPINTNVFSVYGMRVEGNSTLSAGVVYPGLELDVDLVIAQYTRTMSINDRYVSFTVVQPTGDLTSTVTLPNAPNFQNQTKSNGLGDTQILVSAGLYNLPPLTKENYASFKPGFAVGGLARLTLPTGEYDENKSANLGANRYSMQLGTPITFGFGESFLDPRLTTFDLLPSVTFFGDNDDPFGAGKVSQSPLYKLEAHLTHNFNPGIWASIDGIYTYGGETETDNQSDDNKQRSLNMGATLGIQFSKSLGLKLSYGKTIDRNDDGLDGEFARLTLIYTQL
ncbi:MAG: transporter [Gammaproteobacteria bacterium]